MHQDCGERECEAAITIEGLEESANICREWHGKVLVDLAWWGRNDADRRECLQGGVQGALRDICNWFLNVDQVAEIPEATSAVEVKILRPERQNCCPILTLLCDLASP